MIGHRWTAWNGSVFDMRRADGSGIWFTDQGIEGMGMPKSVDFTRDAEVLDGQEFLGWKAPARSVFWPVAIDAGSAWLPVQREFWKSLTPGRYGTWRVTAPDGTYRELQCRFKEASDTYAVDPSESGFEVRGVTLVADDPWWRGPVITRTFTPQGTTTLPFFATTPPNVLNLLSAFSVERAQMENPGDVDAWPVWTVHGPTDGFSVGVGSAVVAADLPIAAGRFVTIDTDPTAQFVQWDTGALVPYADLAQVDFAEVPPGERVTLSTRTDGTGSIDVALSPRFLRAF